MNLKRGFLARIGHIVVIQILFIFTALALVIFYPRQNDIMPDIIQLEQKFANMAHRIRTSAENSDIPLPQFLSSRHFSFDFCVTCDNFSVDDKFSLYLLNQPEGSLRVFEYNQPPAPDDDTILLEEFIASRVGYIAGTVNRPILMPTLFDSRRMVYFYQFNITKDNPAVLVATSSSDLVVSSSSQLKYGLLLLFLSSALITLLLIYLITKRFSEPIRRLINGFNKTAEGELYYLIESEGDWEIKGLAEAFNHMSSTLFSNHKQLRKYNSRLKQAGERLKESRLFYSTLIESLPLSVLTVSPDGKILTFNKQASKEFGYDSRAVINNEFDQLFSSPIYKSHLVDQKSDLSRDGIEVVCKREDETRFPAFMISSAVMGADDGVTAYLVILGDISESKSYQEMMVRIDRYYTRGEMAGDIAHEINNFLAVLQGNIELMPLMIKRGDQQKIELKLEKMKEAVGRIVRFTDGLLDANMGKSEFHQIDVNQLVENVIAFLKPQNRFDEIEVITTLGTDLTLTELDIGQMQQLLVNLINNAADALNDMDYQRKICVSTSMSSSHDKPFIRFEIRDNGPGVLKEKEELLFKKRFTTKPSGHGIGLVTCRRIVDSHQGLIAYEMDNGALFAVEIPVSQDSARSAENARQSGPESQSDSQLFVCQ